MKIFTKVLTVVLTALGFSALSGCVMYGTPSGVYDLDVKVVDEKTEQPIENMKVSLKDGGSNYDVRLTNQYGSTHFNVTNLFAIDKRFTLIVEDLNGEVGSLYKKDSSEVVVNASDFKGGSGTYDAGRASASVVLKVRN